MVNKQKEIRHYRNIIYVLLIAYVAGEQLIINSNEGSAVCSTYPLLLIDLQEKTILYVTDVFNKILCILPAYKQ